jgi:glucan phosphoethanolaminetransferase (alkaline phosphatase superfamily)
VFKIYFIYGVAMMAMFFGGGYVAVVTASPIPEQMSTLSFMFNWVIPLLPGAMSLFVGVRIVTRQTRAPAKIRWWVALSLIGLVAIVIIALVQMWLDTDPVRETAFNWAFYGFPFLLVAYKAEQLMWLKYD